MAGLRGLIENEVSISVCTAGEANAHGGRTDIMNSEILRFLFSSFVRFLAISLLFLVVYLIHGGKTAIVFHSAPTALMMSLIGFGFLIACNHVPRDFSCPEDVKAFRQLVIQVMWVVHIIIISETAIFIFSRIDHEPEVMGATIAGGLAGTAINSVFYLSLLLEPMKSPKREKGLNLDSNLFNLGKKATFWLGCMAWFLIFLTIFVWAFEALGG